MEPYKNPTDEESLKRGEKHFKGFKEMLKLKSDGISRDLSIYLESIITCNSTERAFLNKIRENGKFISGGIYKYSSIQVLDSKIYVDDFQDINLKELLPEN